MGVMQPAHPVALPGSTWCAGGPNSAADAANDRGTAALAQHRFP